MNRLAGLLEEKPTNRLTGLLEPEPPVVSKPRIGPPLTGEAYARPFFEETTMMDTPLESRGLPEATPDYDLRTDGTKKGLGFFGPLKRPDGYVSTELSIGVDFDGKETLIPSLVPTLNKEQIDYLLEGNKPTKDIVDKAVDFAKKRMSEKKPVFAQEGEQVAIKQPYGLLESQGEPTFMGGKGGQFRGHGATGRWDPVGAWEKIKDVDILDVISHAPGSALVGLNDIRRRIYETAKNQLETGDYGPTTQYGMTPMGGYMPVRAPATKEGLQKVVDEYEQKESRGETTVAAIIGGIADLPAYMGEMAAGGIGQVKSVPQAMLFAGKILPIQFGRIEMSLSDKVKQGEKGYMALAKAMGDVYIENLSETAGAAFPVVARKMPFGGKLVDALHDFAKKAGISDSEFWKRMGTKVGYNGLLGEWGEERLATFLRGLVNIDDFGAGKKSTSDQRILAGLSQDLQWQNQMVELGVLSAPGAAKQVGKIAFGRKEAKPPEPGRKTPYEPEPEKPKEAPIEAPPAIEEKITPVSEPKTPVEKGKVTGEAAETAVTIPKAPETAKKPWEMTREEFEKTRKTGIIEGMEEIEGVGRKEPSPIPERPGETYKIKPPKKLYRGITIKGQGIGTYRLGKGLYSTPVKSFLSDRDFKEIIELSPKEAWPKNPLVLRTTDQFEDWLLQESGEDNIREFNKKYKDPGAFVRERGYDGVIAGDEVVKYFEPQAGQTKPGISHVQIVKQAVEMNMPVPRAVLEEYKSEPWSKEALEKLGEAEAPETATKVKAENRYKGLNTKDKESLLKKIYGREGTEVVVDKKIRAAYKELKASFTPEEIKEFKPIISILDKRIAQAEKPPVKPAKKKPGIVKEITGPITKDEKDALREKGFTVPEILKMTPADARAKLKEGKGPIQASVGASKSPQLDAALQRAAEKAGRTTYVSQRSGRWIVTTSAPKHGDYYRLEAGQSKLIKGKTTFQSEADAIKSARYIAKNTKQPVYIWQAKTGFEISPEKPEKFEHVEIKPKGPGLTREERAILSRQQIAEAEIAQEEKKKVGYKAGREQAIIEARNKLHEFLIADKVTDKHRQDAADIVKEFLPKEAQYRYIKRILESTTSKRVDNINKAINLYLDKAEKRQAQRDFKKFVKDIKSRYRRGEVKFGYLPKKVADGIVAALEQYDISKLSEVKQNQLESREKFVQRIAAELANGFEAMNPDFDKDAVDMMVMGQRRIDELKRLSQTHIGELDAEQIRGIQAELDNLLKINELKGQSKERRRMENLRTDINQARQEVKPAKKSHTVEFGGFLGTSRWIAVEGQANISTLAQLSTQKDNAATMKVLADEPKKANRKRLETYKDFIDYFKSRVDEKNITWKDVKSLKDIINVKIGGQNVEMSYDSLLSIFAHTQADGNMRRLLNTKGLNITTYYRNAAGLIQRKKMFRVGKPALEELRAIINIIPEKHKQLLVAYFETNREKQAPAINKTSMDYQNYEIARSEKYFHVDREIDRPIEGTKADVSTSIDMMGRYLPRTGGSARINIRPFSMEVMKSMQSDAAYAEMLISMENARTLLANRQWRENMKRAGNYRALRELTTMFRRVQGLVADQSHIELTASGILRNISKSILSARISGGLVQTASIPASFEFIEPKYFIGKDTAPTPGQIKRLKDLSSVLWMRWEGKQFDYALGLVGSQDAFESMLFGHKPKTDKLLAPYTIGDEVAIWKIWNATKRKIAAETDLIKDSEEFNNKALELLYKALDTQPQWDILYRSSLTSNPNAFLRGMTLFMSARNAQYNVLLRALDDYNKGRIGKAELSKRISGVGMANVFVSLARRIFRIVVKAGAIGLLVALGKRKEPKEKIKQQAAKELKKIPLESVFNLVSLNAFGGIFNNLAYAAIRHHKYPWLGSYSDIRSGNVFADLGMDFIQLAINYEKLTSDIISGEKFKSGPNKGKYKWKRSAKETADLTAQVMAYFFGLPWEGPKADFIWPAQAAAKQTRIETLTEKEMRAEIREYTYKETNLMQGQIAGWPWKGQEKRIEELRAELKKRNKGAE